MVTFFLLHFLAINGMKDIRLTSIINQAIIQLSHEIVPSVPKTTPVHISIQSPVKSLVE